MEEDDMWRPTAEEREAQARIACGKLLHALETVLEKDSRRSRAIPAKVQGDVSSTVEDVDLERVPDGTPAFGDIVNHEPAGNRCVMCGQGGDDVVIPKQNKNICRQCDKATWVHRATNVHFKWCKGCKRFRNVTAFAEKVGASKCDKCRERGRQGYFRRVQCQNQA